MIVVLHIGPNTLPSMLNFGMILDVATNQLHPQPGYIYPPRGNVGAPTFHWLSYLSICTQCEITYLSYKRSDAYIVPQSEQFVPIVDDKVAVALV